MTFRRHRCPPMAAMLTSYRSRLPAVVVACALAAGCGGNHDSPTDPGQTTPGSGVRTVLISGASFSLLPAAATYKNIDLPPDGMLDAVVDWAGPNDINVYVTDNVCPGFPDLRAGRCNLITKADTPTAKPERVSFSTTTAPGRIWTVWIYNNGTSAESGAMEVGVTTDRPLPASTPTPTPTTPAPGGNPTSNLAPGPVVRYTIKVRSIDIGGFNYRDPYQDADGRWVVHPGEFVVFDSTQKNGSGQLCQVQDYPPRWFLTDTSGVLALREGQNNPFLLRTDVRRKGVMSLSARVDGVDSNVLEIASVAR